MASVFWVGGTGTWDASSTTHWSTSSGGATGAAVPTAADDVVFDANSGTGTVTLNASVPCRSLVSPSSTLKTFLHNAGFTLSIGTSTVNGTTAFDYSGFTTYTAASPATSIIALVSTNATQLSLTRGTVTLPSLTVNGAAGSWSQVDGMLISQFGAFLHTAGSYTTNNQTLSMGVWTFNGSTTRAITLGTSAVSVTSAAAATLMAFATAGATVSAASSTITFTNAGNGAVATITPNAFTFGTFIIAGTSAFTITVNSSSTFGTLKILNGPKTINMVATGTKTVTNFFATGSAGNLITIQSTVGASAWTLSKASGTVQCDFLSLKDSTASGGAVFYAGANSTSVSGNTGWTFTGVPGAANTASVSPSATNTHNTLIPLSASQGFTGAINRFVTRALAAILSFVGAVPKLTTRALTGGLSFVGTFAKTALQPFAATLSFSGGMVKSIGVALTAALPSTGVVNRAVTRALAGGVSFTGAFGKGRILVLSAALSFAGGVTRLPGIVLSGALSFTGASSRALSQILAAVLTFTGSRSTSISKVPSAALGFVGNVVRTPRKLFTAALGLTGLVQRQFGLVIAGALNFTGSMKRRVSKGLTATLGSTGALLRALTRALGAGVSFAGSIVKGIGRPLTGTLSPAAALATHSVLARVLNASLGLAGSATRQTARALSGALSFTGRVTHLPNKAFQGTLGLAGVIGRSTRRSMRASLAALGQFGSPRNLRAGLTFTGQVIIRNARQVIDIVLSVVTSYADVQAYELTATEPPEVSVEVTSPVRVQPVPSAVTPTITVPGDQPVQLVQDLADGTLVLAVGALPATILSLGDDNPTLLYAEDDSGLTLLVG